MNRPFQKSEFSDLWSILRSPSSEWVTQLLLHQFNKTIETSREGMQRMKRSTKAGIFKRKADGPTIQA